MNNLTLDANRAAWPTNWDALFERSAPLIIEIGFGGGHFLVDLAEKRPFVNILGIEIANPSIVRGKRKVKVAGVQNVRLTQADAKYVLWALCQPKSISELFINFPDPWRKERHYHRRIISDDFLALAASRLVDGGRLNIATDHADYAVWITERLERTPYFNSRHASTFVTGDAHRIHTKYEKQAIEVGRTCHYYHWQRNETAAPSFATPEEYPMPHVILNTPLSLQAIAEQFPDKIETNDAETAVRATFLDIFHSHHYDALLVETFIHDALIQQHVALAIRRRDDGDSIISLHEIGFPRPTLGVKFGIGQLAKWVIGLHPDGVIKTDNLGLGELQVKAEPVEAVAAKITPPLPSTSDTVYPRSGDG